MSEETKSERSKKCPSIALSAAIDLAKKFYQKAGKTKVKSEVAVNSLGYTSLNGAALTTLGALSQYGLIERDKGSMISISPVAIRVFHPLNKEQEMKSLEEMALNPKVFNELYTNGFQKADDDLIANHLIQNGFTPEKAKKVAVVFKANIELANLKGDGIKPPSDEQKEDQSEPAKVELPKTVLVGSSTVAAALTKKTDMNVATINPGELPVPIAEGLVARVPYPMSEEDFGLLLDTLKLWKNKLVRKAKAIPPSIALPANAMWEQNDGSHKPVKIVALMGEKDGELYYQSEDGTGLPASQLKF
jgi:hypothetical protein